MSDNGPSGGSFDNWALPPQPPAWPSQQPSPPPKRASRLFTLGAAIAATVLIGAVGGVAVAFLTRSPTAVSPGGGSPTPIPTTPADPAAGAASALYQNTLATMSAATGFHYTLTATGPDSETFIGDAEQAGGHQSITFNASYGAEHFNLVLVGGTVYFQGNVPALEDQLGVAAAKAPALVNKWVSVVAGNGPYSVLQPGITTADQRTEVPMVPAASGPATTASGTAVTRITGTIPAQDGVPAATVLFDVLPGSNIPVDYQSTLSANGVVQTTSVTFTQWGTAVAVTAPSGAVAWSTLGVVSPPPGGYGSGGPTSSAPTPTPGGAI
jgi:hypothetical protein